MLPIPQKVISSTVGGGGGFVLLLSSVKLRGYRATDGKTPGECPPKLFKKKTKQKKTHINYVTFFIQYLPFL